MFTKIKQALFKHKLFLTKIAVFFWLYFLMTDFSFASTQNDVDFKKIEDWFIQITTWISTIISVLLWALTYLVTLFLTPEWTSGTVFGLSKNLKDIWVLMSNIVYFAFAFILIAIAFANIVWTQWDFALKQALPRFIVWILIVPFSWFIVQFFVSLSSILTISALNLPFEVFQDYESQMSKVDIPKNCTLNLWVLWEQEWKNSWEGTPSNQIYSCWTEEISVADLLKSDKASDGIFGIVWLYTYWLVNIEWISKIDEKQLRDQIKTIWDIVVKVVFDLLFIVVYAILMIALWLALMIRWIRLWIFMMLAPLFWIMYFFKKWWWGNWFLQKFNFKEFIALTLTPVYAMLALSFWIFFIFVSWKWMTWVTTDLTVKDKEVKIWDFTLTVEWAVSNDLSVTDFLKTIWDWALWVIWALILKIFWIVVLWWAVMAALKQSQITWEIIEPISAFGRSVWELATKIPQFTPILPGRQTLDSLQQLPNKALWALQWYSSVKADDLAWKFWLNNSQNSQAINELNRTLIEMKWNEKNQSFRQNAISKLLNQIKTNNELLTDPKYREKATEVFKASWFDRIKADNIKNVENLSKILVSADWFSQSDVTRWFYRNIVGKDSINENDLIDFLKSSNSVIPESSWSNQSDSQSAININVANKTIDLPARWGESSEKYSEAVANEIRRNLSKNGHISNENIRDNWLAIESQLKDRNKVWLSDSEVAEIKRLLWISNN